MPMTTKDAPAIRPVLPAPRCYSLRLHLLGRSVSTMFTSLISAVC
jgi:hypothetical protein